MSLRELFNIWAHLFTRVSQPKFSEWVKEFMSEHFDNLSCRNLAVLLENFDDWGCRPVPHIDNETYLAVFFLATWLSWRIFNDSSTSIWLEAFHITVEMARHKPYSFGIPYLAWAYRYLREFKETFGQVAMTYGPWVLVVDRLRCYFPHSHNTMTW